MPPQFELRCLGSPCLFGADGEPVRFRTRKHFGLLVYLAVEGRQSHRRQRLAELLWPRVGEAEARHSVATAISMFRHRLGPRSIVADRDNVRLTLPALTIDLTRLQQGDVLGDEVTPPLEIANFLDDFELGDAPEFMLWRTRQQARLFPSIRDGLLLLIDRCRRTGNFRQIEVLADRLLEIDHLSEDGIRAKMEARAFDGDRLSALRLYEEWRTVLGQELGAVPSAQVQGIALRLRRRGWERIEAAEIPNVPTDHWRGHRFVGRANEYRALYESWETTTQGRNAHILLLGDSGVGKTTISDRLITAAGLEGAATVRIQCYEVDRGIPYAALSGLVRGLLERPGANGAPPEALADLAVCVPEIRQRYADLPATGATDGEGTRIQLAEAMQELVTSVAEERPVILVIDDLHLADDASIAVLHLILRRVISRPVMMLFTARLSELERSPSARRVREGAEALNLRVVDVPPMVEAESRELMTALLDNSAQAPNSAEQKAFITAAAGYPMVLELFVQDWLANGKGAMPLILGAMTTDLSEAKAAEHTYKALLDRIIHELSPEHRSVLNLATILGNRLNDLDMYGLMDLTMANIMSGMTALTDLRLLRDNGRELGFRNEMIRAQAYLNVPSTLRKALHGRVLDRLIAAQTATPPTGLELAWHSFRAGRLDEGREYLLRGAREAIDEGAVCEAELALESGMESLVGEKKSSGQVLLAEALQDQGRWIESLRVIERIAEPCSPSTRMMVEIQTAFASAGQGNLDGVEAARLVRSLCSFVRTGESREIRRRALLVCKALVADFRLRDEAQFVLDQLSEARADRLSEDEESQLALDALFLAYFAKISIDPEAVSKSIARIESSGTATRHGRASCSRDMIVGSLRASQGDYSGALLPYHRAYEAALRLGELILAARAAGNISLCHQRIGNLPETEKWAEIGLRQPGCENDQSYFKLIHYLSWAQAMKGNQAASLATIRKLESHLRFSQFDWSIQASELLKSDVLRVLGMNSESLSAARNASSGRFYTLLTSSYAGPFARALSHLGDSDDSCRKQLDRIDETHSRDAQPETIDRVEIACARMRLLSRIGEDGDCQLEAMRNDLKVLPDGVRVALRALGFAAELERAASFPN